MGGGNTLLYLLVAGRHNFHTLHYFMCKCVKTQPDRTCRERYYSKYIVLHKTNGCH